MLQLPTAQSCVVNALYVILFLCVVEQSQEIILFYMLYTLISALRDPQNGELMVSQMASHDSPYSIVWVWQYWYMYITQRLGLNIPRGN